MTGAVLRDGDCVHLDGSGGRWTLTGAAVRSLRTGEQISARGRLRPVPAGCPAQFALDTVSVSTR